MPFSVCPSTKTSILYSKGLKMRVSEGNSAQKPRFCARNARKRGFRSPKAHKNPIFVLGDGCRELSSAATSPAGCIWQQCARQQIAATYHATCRRACCRELPPVQPTAVALPPAHLSPYNLSPCMLPQPAAKTYLPLILPCILPQPTPRHTTARWVPRPAGG